MTFDTTASNTGHITAACVSVQQATGKALLWTACRHHVGEIILVQVFNDLKIESSNHQIQLCLEGLKKIFILWIKNISKQLIFRND